MTDTSQELPPSPATTLTTALGVVVFGTLLIDYTRAWLLLIPLSFLFAAFTAGTFLHRFAAGSSATDQSTMPQLAIRIGTGAAILSLCATLSALAGVLGLAGLIILLLVAAGCVMLARTVRFSRPLYPLIPAASGIILGFVWLIAWLWATIPPIFYDELGYHLVIPERALATGSLQAYPWVFFTLLPHASDLLLAWGMAIDGDLGARAMHWSFWAWSSLAAWGLLEALLRPRSPQWTAALGVAALASSPTLWFLGTLTFSETCLTAALVTTACVLVTSGQHSRPWLTAGLLLGLAGTVKINGLAWVFAGLAAGFVLGWSWRNLALTTLLALASIAPWWGRAAWFTGNPVYPLAYGWLGSGGLWSDTTQALVKGDLSPNAFDLGFFGMLRLPWDLVMHSERFGSAADAGPLAIIAIIAVLLLPLFSRMLGADLRRRQLGDAAAIFVLLSGTAWATTSTTMRFLAPALLLITIAAVSMALALRPASLTTVLAVLMLLGAWGTSRFLDVHNRVFASTAVALGREHQEEYAGRQLDHYDAARFVREHTRTDAKLLMIGEARPFYFARNAVAPSPFDRHPLGTWVQEASSPEDLARRLASEGMTHVVLNVREFRRLHDKYGVLAFTGERAAEQDRRLKELPRALHLLFDKNGVLVFEVPPAT
ncbi:MAG: hypothetical protein EXR96_05545 [Nitrospiraceae bacterium]|nr:hypothetical protein [Nitrospiraceae bacterium]